jgi:hypothetical protein
MLATGVELDDAGAVVVKRAAGDPAAGALRREGERLRRAAHPGVVAVVGSAPTPDGWELRLAHAGRPVSSLGALAPRAVAAISASVATTVADLHDLGIVHGRLDATHVLVGGAGRPVLCGFGDGTGDAARPDDVAAVGRILSDLLGDDAEPELIPERRWRAVRPRTGWERKALLAVADMAVAEPAERRPTARRLAAAITSAVPAATASSLERSGESGATDPIERLRPAGDPDTDAPRPRRALVLALAGVIALVVAVARLRAGSPDPAARDVELEVIATAAPVEGSVVVADGRRYRVGEPGDHLLVDDWWCDGVPTPAVLRPSTHEVFVFEGWTADDPLAIPPTTTVPGATTLVSQRAPDGCPRLAAAVDGGRLVPVDLGRAMSRRRRAVLVLVASLAAQVVLAVSSPSAPASARWADLDRWHAEVGPAVVAMTLLAVVGWLAAAWLALVAALQLAGARNRRSRAAVLADRLAPRFLRSVACQATRLSLGVVVLAPAVPLTSPPPHTAVMVPLDAEPNQAAPAEPGSTSTSTTATTVAPPTSEPPSTTTTTTVPPSTTTTTTTTATASPAPPAPSDARPPVPASDEVVVRPGDSFWSIAEEEADGDVVSYWRALIDANRDRLVDPGNPDLLYPEQVLRLPAR